MFIVELFVVAKKLKNKNSTNSWMNNEIVVYLNNGIVVAVVQSLSCVQLLAAPWTVVGYSSFSFTISQSLLKLMCIESVMPSNHLILCLPLLLLLSIFPSIRVFSSESGLGIRWPKYWSCSFICPSNEYSRLISFRIDCFDLLSVQGTLKSLLQHHISKASVLWRSVFFMVELSHLYMTTGNGTPLQYSCLENLMDGGD